MKKRNAEILAAVIILAAIPIATILLWSFLIGGVLFILKAVGLL